MDTGGLISPCRKSRGKNAKFAQNLSENCAENALKLCAICAQMELKNRQKIAKNLRFNVLWLR